MEGPMTIREFCRTTNLSAHTLRYYERAGIMPRVERTTSGHRRYTARHILWVQFLRRLRDAGRQHTSLFESAQPGTRRRRPAHADAGRPSRRRRRTCAGTAGTSRGAGRKAAEGLRTGGRTDRRREPHPDFEETENDMTDVIPDPLQAA